MNCTSQNIWYLGAAGFGGGGVLGGGALEPSKLCNRQLLEYIVKTIKIVANVPWLVQTSFYKSKLNVFGFLVSQKKPE